MKPLTVPVALCAPLPTVMVAGCGGVSGDAVATVDGEPIEMESFDHWMNVAARSSRRPHAEVPRPPDYAACSDQKRKAQPKRVKGRSRTTDDQLKRECEQEYDALRDQVLQLLVTNRWLEGEATDRGITGTDSEVEEAFDRQRKESFPKKADYEKFLESSGQTERDILLRVRVDLLSDKFRDQVTKGKDRVTDRQIVAYYKSNKARFGQPERRGASRKTLEQVMPTIRQVLASESQQKLLDEFLSEFRKKWRTTTECREGYETPSCANGPEATPAPAQTSGVP